MYENNNISDIKNQVFLEDKKEDGRERPWRDKKMRNQLLQESYNRIGYESKARRADECGSYLEFKVLENGKKKLANAKFCQIRLCPMCNWRRELKLFSQLSKVVKVVEDDGYKFLLLTLTCKNVDGSELNRAIDHLFKSFKRLFELKAVDKIAKGYFRALEITHDIEPKITRVMYRERKSYYDSQFLKVGDMNPNFNKYHPHFHVMIAVNRKYFKGQNYIKQSEWVKLWQQSLRVEYEPIIDVRSIKNDGGVREVAKYTVKDSEFIVKEDRQLTDETVAVLDKALAYRRLVAYGGLMKKIHKELNLDEDISADVNITEDGEIIEIPYVLEIYNWHIGFSNYVLVRKEEN